MKRAKFTLEFETENDFFVEGGPDAVAELLRTVAEQVQVSDSGTVIDGNGNVVGAWSVEYPEPVIEDDDYDPYRPSYYQRTYEL